MLTRIKRINWIILIGLASILYFFSPFFNLQNGFVVKYDYVLQHVLFYKEFYALLSEGLPAWSWNMFAGINFWGSKAYYLIGDLFVWLGYPIYRWLGNLTYTMFILMMLKFWVAIISFDLWLSNFTSKSYHRILFVMMYAFSGWNLVFMEHPVYTSFYALLPLLLAGLERYLRKNKFDLLIVSVALLTATNFYLFWVASNLFLIYWIVRFIQMNTRFNFKHFFVSSLKLLCIYMLGVLIAAPVWLPGVLHLIQSQRIGSSLGEYSQWNWMHIGSFLMFTATPMLKYLNGVFKDYWYYFNQVGLYFGLLPLLLLPHQLYIGKTLKDRLIGTALILLMVLLMVSPKVGLYFHFTYSIRYTIIIVILALYLSFKTWMSMDRMHWAAVLITQIVIVLIYFLVKKIYQITYVGYEPGMLIELDSFNTAFILSFAYSALLLIYSLFKQKFVTVSMMILMLGLSWYELSTHVKNALASQYIGDDFMPYYVGNDLEKAIDTIQSIDDGIYRIYTNSYDQNNINIFYEYQANSTYDSTFQYTLSDFLRWSGQWPETNWSFSYFEPSFNEIMNVQYAAIYRWIDPLFVNESTSIQLMPEVDFGNYAIYQFNDKTSFGRLYYEVDSTDSIETYLSGPDAYTFVVGERLLERAYIDSDIIESLDIEGLMDSGQGVEIGINPSVFSKSVIRVNVKAKDTAVLFLSMAYDKGWSASINNEKHAVFACQGGFTCLKVEEGQNEIELNYSVPGLKSGILLLVSSLIILWILLKFRRNLLAYNRNSINEMQD